MELSTDGAPSLGLQESRRYYEDSPIDALAEIRLLELEAGHFDDPISCSLRTSKPSTEGDGYEALSYTWGESDGNHSITIGNVPGFAVTDNLFKALRRLRQPTTSRTLWVDAICINQADFKERGHQVQLMCDIYRYARCVLVWLGETKTESRPLLSSYRVPDVVAHAMARKRGSVYDANKDRVSAEEDFKMRTLEDAICITEPSWWTRVWIVQEVVLARSVMFHFGSFALSWTDLEILIEQMDRAEQVTDNAMLGHDEPRNVPSRSNPRRLVRRADFTTRQFTRIDFNSALESFSLLRDSQEQRVAYGLAELSSITATNQCQDPRDRVLGYYGLWSDRDCGLLTPDYQASPASIYAAATYADIQNSQSLRVLTLVQNLSQCDTLHLPTWCMDFAFSGRTSLGGVVPWYNQPLRLTPKDYSGLMNQYFRPIIVGCPQAQVSFEKAGGRLQCKGFIIDRVTSVHLLKGFGDKQLQRTKFLESLLHMSHSSFGARDEASQCQDCVAIRSGTGTRNEQALTTIFDLMKQATLLPPEDEWAFSYPRSARWFWLDYRRLHMGGAGALTDESLEAVFITESGLIGRALPYLRQGDYVTLLYGLELPVVLRPVGESFTFHGLAEVKGIMEGELNKVIENLTLQDIAFERDFVLL